MQPLTNDATTALLRALRHSFAEFPAITFEEIRSRSWSSATFAGARHEITFRLDGEGCQGAADRFLLDIDSREFTLRGHVVADMALSWKEVSETCSGEPVVRLKIEVLTVEDG